MGDKRVQAFRLRLPRDVDPDRPKASIAARSVRWQKPAAHTAALADKPTEAEVEVQFQRSVVHARHIRDRAFDLLEKKFAAKRSTAPAGA